VLGMRTRSIEGSVPTRSRQMTRSHDGFLAKPLQLYYSRGPIYVSADKPVHVKWTCLPLYNCWWWVGGGGGVMRGRDLAPEVRPPAVSSAHESPTR
jgi:hypothetical protein